ncbi:hypothetical protein K470DRAFT_197988, partial [Piedraia hortae CBS 480.64]
NSAVTRTKTAVKFLVDPNDKTRARPEKFRTRTFLRGLRYLGLFLFWRAVRYVKYAAIGAIAAAVGGTVIGSMVSGAAFLLAPTGVVGGAGMGLLWAFAKFGWHRAKRQMKRAERGEHVDPKQDE